MEKEKKFADLKVGDTIWTTVKPYRSGAGESLVESIVTKVGRKYLTVESKGTWKNERRYEIADGVEETGGYSQHATYLVRSPEQYLEDQFCNKLFRELTHQWRNMYNCPDHVTRADIMKLAEILKIDLSNVK